MAGASIENPIINTPFAEPARHFVTTPDGKVTGEILERRRASEFFVPVARPRKGSAQLTMDQFGGPTRQQPNEIALCGGSSLSRVPSAVSPALARTVVGTAVRSSLGKDASPSRGPTKWR